MIHEHNSIVRSKRVLAALKKLMGKSKIDLYLTHWAGGREQGYHLSWRLQPGIYHGLSFAEARGSDQVVIVHGPEEKFDPCDHVPAEELWKKPNLIYVDEADAAGKIWNIIQQNQQVQEDSSPLTKAEQRKVDKDFRDWSGGSDPHECDGSQITVYVDYANKLPSRTSAVREYLTEKQNPGAPKILGKPVR